MTVSTPPALGAAPVTEPVRALAAELPTDELPAYVHDLGALKSHLTAIRALLPDRLELLYAAKANSEPPVLAALGGVVDAFDLSSGGELAHVRGHQPTVPVVLSGPGKTPAELRAALDAGVERIHVESLHELAMIDTLAARPVDVLLRVNLPVGGNLLDGNALAMGGSPSPFGTSPEAADEALRRLAAGALNRVRILGVHAHLASGLAAGQQAALAATIVDASAALFARHDLPLQEVNVGGGMGVAYDDPWSTFDWATYAADMRRLLDRHPGVTVRIEPGRAITAYSGWYITEVLDVKHSHGRDFAVVRGGTHHLRTPATKGHDQPCAVLAVDAWQHPWPRPSSTGDHVDVVGQLCTPKDLLARDVLTPGGLRAGDRIAFAMAGAYAWSISHHDFLMHPHPGFHYIGA